MAEPIRELHVSPEEIEKGKTMAVIAYFIFFIPLLMDEYRKNKFVMFHTEQSILIAILYVAGSILSAFCIGFLLFIPALILQIIGIMNALNGKMQPLPVIGQYGEKFNFVK